MQIPRTFYKMILAAAISYVAGLPCPGLAQEGASEKSTAADTQNAASTLAVDLNLRDTDIRDVARAFSVISGKNIIVSEDAKAKVTLKVQSMDWKSALNMILGSYNLTMVENESYIIITTLDRRKFMEESGDLKTKVIAFNFTDVASIQKTLAAILTKRGRIEVDARTNSLIINDIQEKIDEIVRVASELDTQTPQVMIEAMMVDVKLTGDLQWGSDWDVTNPQVPFDRYATQTLNAGRTEGVIHFGKTITPWTNLSALIDMWQQSKKAEILANPKILTLDNFTATIDLLEQVPYLKQTQSTDGASAIATVEFKDVGVRLYVKPHITKDNHVFMNVKTEQSFRSGEFQSQPLIDTRKSETNLMVKDGETIVIGGLRKKEKTSTIDKIPILGDIPFFGQMFRKTVKSNVNSELLIFVTPHIVTEKTIAKSEQRYEEFITEYKFKDSSEGAGSLHKGQGFSLRAPSAP